MPPSQEPFHHSLLDAFHSTKLVRGLTHTFYRYPARFSPDFAHAVIQQYTSPGDIVLDPFVGGGTSVVESLANGRIAVGVDVSSLACFLTEVKTTPLAPIDKETILSWLESHPLSAKRKSMGNSASIRNLPIRYEVAFAEMLRHIAELPRRRQRSFARCLLTRTAQWALDCRDHAPQMNAVSSKLYMLCKEMFKGIDEFVCSCRSFGVATTAINRRRYVFNDSALHMRRILRQTPLRRKPVLVLTSPPYPGVHVLYHRWQIQGRRETAAPFWLAGVVDGQGSSHFTLGSRSASGIQAYFVQIRDIFTEIRHAISPQAHVVQLMSFADSETQLPIYLDAMRTAGFIEEDRGPDQGSYLWRSVPHRKWYSHTQHNSNANKEVLLIHRPK